MIDSPSPNRASPQAPADPGGDPRLGRLVDALRRQALRTYGGAALFAWIASALLSLWLCAILVALGVGNWLFGVWLGWLSGSAALAAFFTWRHGPGRPRQQLAASLEAATVHASGLQTALALQDELASGRATYSAELAFAHVEVVAQQAERLDPSLAFSKRWLRRSQAGAGAATLLLAGTALAWPAFATSLGAMWRSPAQQAEAGGAVGPITGNVALTYVYPRYTGLPPKTIEGSNGEISALAGTEVRIETRSDRPVAKAFIDLEESSLPLRVEGERQLEGSLVLQRSGSYRFRFEDARGRQLAVGPAIPITVTEDAPPSVTLEAPVAELTVSEREVVELRYDLGDDFGISELELVYRLPDGEEQVQPIGSWAEPRQRHGGSYSWDLTPLALRAGETVTYYLRAKDNDTVSGPKWGQSRSQVLVVFSEAEHRRQLTQQIEAAWEQMILALGDRITPREGPRRVEGDARIEAGRPADEAVRKVVGTFQTLAADMKEDEFAPGPLVAAVDNIATRLAPKARSTRAQRQRASHAGSGRAGALRELDRVEADEQGELERSVLYLESLLDRQRLLEIEEISRELAESRGDLARLIERYQQSPDDESRRAVLREVERLRQRMGELLRRMAELGKGIRDEHLNAEAMKALSEERDILGQLDEVERLVAEGKVDDALAELQKLALQMEQMTQAIEEALDGHVENDPALAELMEDIEKYDRDLAALEAEQKELTEATQQLRREEVREAQERLGRDGDWVEELRHKAMQARGHLLTIPGHELARGMIDELNGATERLQTLDASLEARDFDAALESAALALAHVESLIRHFDNERRIAERYRIELPEGFSLWREDTAAASPLVAEVKERLERLFAGPRRPSPQRQRQLESLAERQKQLGEQMQALREHAQRVGERAPIFDDESMQSMEQASRSMAEAEGRLRGRDTGGALVAERSAQEGLRALRESLEQAKEQARNNRGGGGFPMPLGGGGGRGGSNRGGTGNEKVEIPDQSKAPEAYRKEILDAMKRDAPEGFQEPVRDYYEEIVR